MLTVSQEIAPGQEPTLETDTNNPEDPTAGNEDGDIQKDMNGEAEQDVSKADGTLFGFDPMAAGGFPGMGMGGDFNQMQMMLAMQNGMGTSGFGNFPMMGKLNQPTF
jgi:hypothetical protein